MEDLFLIVFTHEYLVVMLDIYGLHYILKASTYEKELEEMKNMTRQEFVASLRRLYILLSSNFQSYPLCLLFLGLLLLVY